MDQFVPTLKPVVASTVPVLKFYRVGGGVSAPRIVSQVNPGKMSKPTRGTTVVRAFVDEKGNVVDVNLFRGFDAEADDKAMEAVRQWRFDPATKDGKPVPVVIAVEINFKLY
jgi:protein TonB